jgi:hypothetical protein
MSNLQKHKNDTITLGRIFLYLFGLAVGLFLFFVILGNALNSSNFNLTDVFASALSVGYSMALLAIFFSPMILITLFFVLITRKRDVPKKKSDL